MMVLDLTGLWRFQPDPSGTGLLQGYADVGYDEHRWREVWVPTDFETCHPGLDTYEGAGWFRRWVTIPTEWDDRRVVLRFEGINAYARVWVNEQEVGAWDFPFLPHAMDIHRALKPGEPALIAVCVDNERRPGDVPGTQRGWRNYGGILREVTLTATDRCYMHRVAVTAVPQLGGGYLDLQVLIHNTRTTPDLCRISLVIDGAEADGSDRIEFVGTPTSLDVGASVTLTLTGDIPEVTPWSPDHPRLYTARLSLSVVRDSCVDVIDTRELRIGFRTIEAREGQLLLNGTPIFLTGFNRHEDSPNTAMRPDPQTTRHDLKAMKEAGANFVRLCHYPHHPSELDLCDELGLLAMAEIPLYWWGAQNEGPEALSSKLTAARRQLEALVWRDRCHPSVIAWSVSNETHEDCEEVAAGNVELVRMAKSLDPTRLAVHVSDHWQRYPNFEVDDVVCVNGYPSVGPLAGGLEPGYDLARSTSFWHDGLEALHRRYPIKPILVTEFGYTSLFDVTDGPYGGDTHAAVLEAEFSGMQAPYVCGATVWCWADHPWPPATFAFCGHLAVSPYGVLTRDRFRKRPFWTIRRLYRARQGIADQPRPEGRPAPSPSGYGVEMVRTTLQDIPVVVVPEGFSIRAMRPDEGGLWTDIWRDAEEFGAIEPTLFQSQFGADVEALRWRGYIVQDSRGVGVATITSWYNRAHKGQDYGQIHWVATRRSHWGLGLGKAMLSYALRQMAQWHERAFLGTQTRRLAAIKLYLDFGFVPDLDGPWAREAWREVREVLDHPALFSLEL